MAGGQTAKPLTVVLVALVCLFLLWDFYRVGDDDPSRAPAVHSITTNYGVVLNESEGVTTAYIAPAAPSSP